MNTEQLLQSALNQLRSGFLPADKRNTVVFFSIAGIVVTVALIAFSCGFMVGRCL